MINILAPSLNLILTLKRKVKPCWLQRQHRNITRLTGDNLTMSNQDLAFFTVPVMLKATVELIDSARTDTLYYALHLSVVSADCRLVCANSQSNRTQERRKCASLRSPTDCSDMANRPVFKGYGWIQLDILCYAAYHEQRQYQYVVNKISDLLASPLHFIYITCDMSGGQGLAAFSTLPSCWRPDLEIVAKSGYNV